MKLNHNKIICIKLVHLFYLNVSTFAVSWLVYLLLLEKMILLRLLCSKSSIHFATLGDPILLIHWSLHFWEVCCRLCQVHRRWPPPSPVDPRACFHSCYHAPSPMWSGWSSYPFLGFISPPWWAQPSCGGFWGLLLPLVLFCCQFEWLEFIGFSAVGANPSLSPELSQLQVAPPGCWSISMPICMAVGKLSLCRWIWQFQSLPLSRF